MQDIQNIPNPDIDSDPATDTGKSEDTIPTFPPDEMPPPEVKEPTETEPQPKIDEDSNEPPMIV